MKYLKYEKTLYEISDEQAKIITNQIEKNKRIMICDEVLNPNKCEIISDLPYNKDDYFIKNKKDNFLLNGEEYYSKINREHSENMKRWLSQTPEQKTEREWDCIILTKYLLRNKWQEPNPQRIEMIKTKVLEWFKENNRAWCSPEVYEDLLPPVIKIITKGWQSVGELAGNRI